MAYPQFEDLQVWQKSKQLTGEIFTAFHKCDESALRDQLQRDALGIMNNIAKGYERKGAYEFDRFLYIARGYCGELKSTLLLAEDLKCLSKEQREAYFETIVAISKMLSGLIKRLNGRKSEGKSEEKVASEEQNQDKSS